MRSVLLTLSGIVLVLLIALSCSKEKSFESNASKGSLQSDSTGDCLPSVINGVFYADSALVDSVNYIDVQAEITSPGSYTITSDTVDGFYFKGEGDINATGMVTIRLPGHGTPAVAGTFTLNITYGTTSCAKEITVLPGGNSGTSVYSLEDNNGDCPVPTFAGVYSAGVPTDASNTMSFDVTVTQIGTYAITATSDDGITFTGSGSFTATGKQNVVLQASGTPQTEGDATVTLGDCDLDLTVVANNLPDAVLAVNCNSVQINGIYTASIATTAQNTVTFTAVVSQAGKYSFSTTTADGVTFSGSGTFTTASPTPQGFVLTADGTPVTGGASYTFSLSGNGNTCSFDVPVAAPPSPAVFTLTGAPNACTNATVQGNYTAGTALDATNVTDITIDITKTGAISFSTNTVDGITFTATATADQTGQFHVNMYGSGTPTAAGTFTFTPQIGSSSCTFTVTVADVPKSDGIYTCKIDNVFTTFNDRSGGKIENDIFTNYQDQLYLDGFTDPANGQNVPEFQIFITKTDGTTITTGTYDEKHFIPPGTYRIEVDYTEVHADNSVTKWNTSSNFLTTNPPFTIVVTSLTSTRVKGTFSGKLTNIFEGSTGTKTITEGTFDLPIVP